MSSSAPLDETNWDPYGYTPSLATAIVFIIIFLSSTLLHTWQIFGRKPRVMAWMVVFLICGVLEIIGWGGRIWSHFIVNGQGFIMQIVCLSIAPTFMSAGLYGLLGVLVKEISPETSVLSAKWFQITFIVADVVSIVVQSVGGGIAASSTTDTDVRLGGRIMLAGIAFQLFVMIVYVIYGAVWLLKSRGPITEAVRRLPGGEGIKRTIWSMAICSVMIIVRGFYRSTELGQGFDGAIAYTELLFLLDAIPVVLAMVIVNILHPNQLLLCFYDTQALSSPNTIEEMGEVGDGKKFGEADVEMGRRR